MSEIVFNDGQSNTSPCEAYATREDIEMIFGAENVSKWADLDNDQNALKIEARVSWALCLAKERLDDKLRGSLYTIPFADPAPRTIIDVNARMAGVLLYESRGIIDMDANGNPVHQLAPHSKLADATIRDIIAGRIVLAVDSVSRTYPTVVEQE